MRRVTFDTNIYVSALTHKGAAARLLLLAAEGAFALQLSDAILDETAEILERKFGWPQEDIQEASLLLSGISQHIVPHLELDVVKRDPDDNRILECAQASRSDFIVTSDKDLLDLKVYAGAMIIQPSAFLAILQQR